MDMEFRTLADAVCISFEDPERRDGSLEGSVCGFDRDDGEVSGPLTVVRLGAVSAVCRQD